MNVTSNNQAFQALLNGEVTQANRKRAKIDEPEFTMIQAIKTPRGTMNHTYRDFSRVKPEVDYEHPQDINQMTFSQKVHHILSETAFEKWISWMPHGRSFKVHIPVLFEKNVCPKYFGHKRYSSFLRDLNNYGFKHISKGTDRNSYYHEFMLQDRPHLCQFMPKLRDARRLVADPTNEPNFYKITEEFPLSPLCTEGAASPTNEEPAAKRARNEMVVTPPQTATGYPREHIRQVSNDSFVGVVNQEPGASAATAYPHTVSSGGLFGLVNQVPAAAPQNQMADLLQRVLEAQNKKREEKKRQEALQTVVRMLHQQPAVMHQQAPQPTTPANLAALLVLLNRHAN